MGHIVDLYVLTVSLVASVSLGSWDLWIYRAVSLASLGPLESLDLVTFVSCIYRIFGSLGIYCTVNHYVQY